MAIIVTGQPFGGPTKGELSPERTHDLLDLRQKQFSDDTRPLLAMLTLYAVRNGPRFFVMPGGDRKLCLDRYEPAVPGNDEYSAKCGMPESIHSWKCEAARSRIGPFTRMA